MTISWMRSSSNGSSSSSATSSLIVTLLLSVLSVVVVKVNGQNFNNEATTGETFVGTVSTATAPPGDTHQNRDDDTTFHNREILLNLYQSTSGLHWNNANNWLQQDTDVCDWFGITCYIPSQTSDERRIGHIKSIDLTKNHLVGTISSDIFEIPYLKELILDDNTNIDSIDLNGLQHAQFLTTLAMSNTNVGMNDLVNINSAGTSSSIEILHITQCKNLQGNLPLSLFDLTNLKELYGNFNKFSGSIPTYIGRLSNLEKVYLYNNDLTGQLPTEFGLLTHLEVLTLGQNALSGSIPQIEFNLLTNLQTLSLQREGNGNEKGGKENGMIGSIPSFSNFKYLTELYLNNQNFNGNLDTNFL